MYRDDIIEEVWKNRDDYVKSHKHSLSKMIADLEKRQSKSELVDRRQPMKTPSKINKK